MFKRNYSLFGHELVCISGTTNSCFKLESDSYKYIKRIFPEHKFNRVDTVDQKGFPDILLLKEDQYLLIEAKLLKKKKLDDIKDDLVFQFGQLAFAERALAMNLNYLLFIVKDNHLAWIGKRRAIKCLDNA